MNDFNFTSICRRYYDYSTDAPPNFGEIMGINLLGHSLGYDAVHLIQPEAVHHNMYVMMLGESSTTRKSTVQWLGEKCYPIERCLPFESSPEQFWVELSKRNEAMQFLGEFSGVLKSITHGGYMSKYVEYWNDLHRCPPIAKRTLRKKKGEENEWAIKNGYLSLVSTITPEMLKKFLTEELTVGGFLPRWLLVEGKPNVKPRRRLHPNILKLNEQLRQILDAIIQMNREIHFAYADGALKRYNEIERWAYKNHNKARAFVARDMNYVVAISDILLVDDAIGKAIEKGNSIYDYKSLKELVGSGGGISEVPAKHVNRAWEIVKPCLNSAEEIVDYVLYEEHIGKIRDCIKDHGSITHSDVLRKTHQSASHMREAISTLIQAGEVKKEEKTVKHPKRGAYVETTYVWIGG